MYYFYFYILARNTEIPNFKIAQKKGIGANSIYTYIYDEALFIHGC